MLTLKLAHYCMTSENKNQPLNIKEGMFYNELSGYSIKIDKKLENGTDLEGVMIYDHTSE